MKNKGIITGILKMIGILSLLLYSCAKKDPQPIYLTDAVKKLYNYQPGTYWVFYDSLLLTPNKDSFVVVSNHTVPPFTGGKEFTAEETYIDIKVFEPGGVSYTWSINLSAPSGIIAFGPGVEETIFFSVPPDYAWTKYHKYELLPSYSTVNGVYDSVYKITTSIDSGVLYGNSWSHDIFVISPKVGFVAIKYDNSGKKANLSLLRYKIVK